MNLVGTGSTPVPNFLTTINENQCCTLFFRFIPGADNAAGATNIVGLTDKSMRGYGDCILNIGPVLYLAALTNDVVGATTNAWYIGARNGYIGSNSSNPIEFPGPALEAGAVYNVWVDITNVALSTFTDDTFTVYVQKRGTATRTVLFQDYRSDRDPYYTDPVLGDTLQQATSVEVPWTDVAGNPASPFLVTPAGAATFYRSRL